jgi:PAS domain S-box-containing protein
MSDNVSTIKVLLIEDNLGDIQLVTQALKNRAFGSFSLVTENSLQAAFLRLKEEIYDVILAELLLSEHGSFEVISKLAELGNNVPIVILTGSANRDKALEAIKNGAQDYLIKGGPSDESLCRVLCFSVERKRYQDLVQSINRKAAETELNLALSVGAAKLGLWNCDIAEDKLTWNEYTHAMFGFPPDLTELTFEEFLGWLHPDDREKAKLATRMSTQKREFYDVEYRVVRKDGSMRNIVSRGKTFFDSSGSPIRMSGVCADITQLKTEEEKAQRLALMEEREELMLTLTHDLKNPLVNVHRVLDIISQRQLGPLTVEQEAALTKLRGATDRTLFMIQNLLDVARYDHDQSVIKTEELDILAVIELCVESLAPILEDRKIEVMTKFPDERLTVRAESIAIKRVVLNLLDNAIKFSSPGGTIQVRVDINRAEVRMEIEDDGAGIALSDQQVLFQRLRHGSPLRASKPGSGLGLYLCQKILDSLNGRIECESALGRGTTFTVNLPRSNPT